MTLDVIDSFLSFPIIENSASILYLTGGIPIMILMKYFPRSEEDDPNAALARRNQTTAVILCGVIGALFDLELEQTGTQTSCQDVEVIRFDFLYLYLKEVINRLRFNKIYSR